MPDNVIRFPDPDRKSREADACAPRDPGEAVIIILPVPARDLASDQPEEKCECY